MINDTLDFFSLDDFAELVTLNDGRKIKAIYDRVQVINNDGFSQVAGYNPQLTIQSVDLSGTNAEQGSQVVIRGKNYSVVEAQEDGTGITTVFVSPK